MQLHGVLTYMQKHRELISVMDIYVYNWEKVGKRGGVRQADRHSDRHTVRSRWKRDSETHRDNWSSTRSQPWHLCQREDRDKASTETHTLRQTDRRTDRPEEMGRPKQVQIKTESETKTDRDKEWMDRRRQTAIRDGHNLSIQNLKLAPESGIFRSAHSLTSWHCH